MTDNTRHAVSCPLQWPQGWPRWKDCSASQATKEVLHEVKLLCGTWPIISSNAELRQDGLPCGYDGEHDMPSSWECVAWKAVGGYASTAAVDTDGKANRHRERIFFSPHCLSDDLFSGKGGA